MTIQEYLSSVNKRFTSGISREHSYRADFVITKGKIPIGYIEVKDIGKNLNPKQYKEQFVRYKKR